MLVLRNSSSSDAESKNATIVPLFNAGISRFLSFTPVETRSSSMTATSDTPVRKSLGLAKRYCAAPTGCKEKPDMQISQLLIPVPVLESLINPLSGREPRLSRPGFKLSE